MGRMELRGRGRVLGGPGVSDLNVSHVRTPTKLPHFCLRFAGDCVRTAPRTDT